MKLIIGGAYQGKLTYAVNEFGIAADEILDLANSDPMPGYACYTHLEAFTARAVFRGDSYEDLMNSLMPVFAGSVVISREIGCGIVPMDKAEREWRELHGRLLSALAKEADQVIRIFCGLEEKLK